MITAIIRLLGMEHRSDMPPVVEFTSPPPTRRATQKFSQFTSMGWFEHLLETRPLTFWSGVWVSVFLVGVVAFGSLLSPNAAERRSVSAIALGSDSGVATQPLEERGKVPLWLFGAIAITCTAGSIMVSRQLQTRGTCPVAPPQQRTKKRTNKKSRSIAPSPAKPSCRTKKQASRQPQRLQPYTPTESMFGVHPASPAIDPVHPVSSRAGLPIQQTVPLPDAVHPSQFGVKPGVTSGETVSFVVTKKSSSKPSSPQPSHKKTITTVQPSVSSVPVSVVPPDQVHPLDWNQPRLADVMDLRKRQSIQSLM